MKKNILYLICILTIFSSCKKSSDDNTVDCTDDNILHEPLLQIQGKIKVQGFTYHQYGTHYIVDDTTYYALESNLFNLDSFVGLDTVLIGKKVPGYPINAVIDPDLIEVIDFK